MATDDTSENFINKIKQFFTHKPMKKIYRTIILILLTLVVNNTNDISIQDIISTVICNNTAIQ